MGWRKKSPVAIFYKTNQRPVASKLIQFVEKILSSQYFLATLTGATKKGVSCTSVSLETSYWNEHSILNFQYQILTRNFVEHTQVRPIVKFGTRLIRKNIWSDT